MQLKENLVVVKKLLLSLWLLCGAVMALTAGPKEGCENWRMMVPR